MGVHLQDVFCELELVAHLCMCVASFRDVVLLLSTCRAFRDLIEPVSHVWALHVWGSEFWIRAAARDLSQSSPLPTWYEELRRIESFQITMEAHGMQRWNPDDFYKFWSVIRSLPQTP